MADIPIAEQIDAMRLVIVEMESVTDRTMAFDRVIDAMHAAMNTLIDLQLHMDDAAAL